MVHVNRRIIYDSSVGLVAKKWNTFTLIQCNIYVNKKVWNIMSVWQGCVFVDVHNDDNLSVQDIPHMRRSSSIQSLNSDFVDGASDDSFQKEVKCYSYLFHVILLNFDKFSNIDIMNRNMNKLCRDISRFPHDSMAISKR